ncbi:uncharacterized protein RSE6_05286 [Rhynchosporium secalis]|uniref:Extracellular serine-rich protein n=1 Tax=Rhynchosporium secalis TaxID=38038 RepID=A0A1E1M7E7_RHYSE|nr:uncharacterized protein RSE6_05286 [Rhynchosporium secalis]
MWQAASCDRRVYPSNRQQQPPPCETRSIAICAIFTLNDYAGNPEHASGRQYSAATFDYGSLSEFACIPYEVNGIGKQGFWSGFKPVSVILPDPPKFRLLINDTEPIFFYCSAPAACNKDGMVGVINPNSTHTFETQYAFAHNSTLAFGPGESFPVEEDVPTKSASSSSSTSTTSASTAAATIAPTTSPASPNSHQALSAGAIAGIAIGGAVVLLVFGALVYLCGRQRTMGELFRHNQHPPPPSYVSNPGRMSAAASPGYKSPHVEDPSRFSSAAGYYTNENESYRSRSPPFEESMEYSSLTGSNLAAGKAGSASPGRSPLTPITLTDRPVFDPIGSGDNIGRTNSQTGPHEMPTAENGQIYTPYSIPR